MSDVRPSGRKQGMNRRHLSKASDGSHIGSATLTRLKLTDTGTIGTDNVKPNKNSN